MSDSDIDKYVPEERLRRALRAAHIAAWEGDLETGRLTWSDNVIEVLGWTFDVAKDFDSRVHPDDWERHQAALHQCASEGGPYDVEIRFIKPDGTVIWIHDAGEMLTDRKGRRIMSGVTIDITARKQAEAEAHEKATILEATLEYMDQGLLMFDASEIVRVYNQKALELLDLPSELFKDKPSFRTLREYQLTHGEFIHSDKAFRDWVASRGMEDDRDLYERVRPNGTVLEVRTVPLPDGGAVRTYTDITARRQAEARLRASEERLRLAMEATNLVTYDRDLRTGEGLWSGDIHRILGLPETVSISLGEFEARFHPEDRQRFEATFDRKVSIVDWPHNIEFRIVRADDGEVRWLASVSRTFPDQNGQPARFLGVLQDITDRKRAELAARESERRLSTLVGNLPGLAYRCLNEPGWPMQYISEGIRDVIGYEPADFQGASALTWREVIHPDDYEFVWNEVQKAVSEHRAFELTYQVRAKDGSKRYVWERGRAVYDQSGALEALEGFISDITEQRRTEEQLRQAQKMEAIGQLTGGVAHDFNNLLTVVLGNAEILAEQSTDPGLQALASMIAEAAARGADLTQKLLAFGRRQSLKPAPLMIDEVVQGMMGLLKRTLGEHIEIRTASQNARSAALADRTLLENALLNLVVNARDAMPQGGKVTIRTGERAAGRGHGSIPAGQPVVFVTVKDTGTGMSPKVIERAFEPFFTTKGVGQGSGLGLAMVYGFAGQSGGHVKIQSKEGKGTSITILLPAVRRAYKQTQPSPRLNPERGHERVLVVEDEPSVRQFVCAQLADFGYEVEAVANGPEALKRLSEDKNFDVLFTDVVLPEGMSGVQLAKRAKEISPTLKVLLTSGYPEKTFRGEGRPSSGVPLLRKPFRRKELAEVLRLILKPTVS